MEFRFKVDIDTINAETSRCLGVVFTDMYLREFFTRNPQLVGYIAGQTHSLDTYEREWLMEELSEDNINMRTCMNMDSDETKNEWQKKWLEFIATSDRIDRDATLKANDETLKEAENLEFSEV